MCVVSLLVFGAHACLSRFLGLTQVILSLAKLTHILEDSVKEHLPKMPNRSVSHHTFRFVLHEIRDRDPLK